MKPCLYVALVIGIFIGGFWAGLPYFTYRLPPIHDNWTRAYYSGILREKYPWHVLNPAWFIYGIRWPLAESFARFGILIIALAVILILSGLIRRQKPQAT